jgi:AcrR family transcriptional regulator
MKARIAPTIAGRRRPRQARSSELVAAVMQAALEVLRKEGSRRLTMARIAERAGVSVGSVYQYFPNKAALLFRIQSEEWSSTSSALASILDDEHGSWQQRLARAVRAFVVSECDEASVRRALTEVAPQYREAREAKETRAASAAMMLRFIEETAPNRSREDCELAAELVLTTLSAVGRRFSEQARTAAEIDRQAAAVSELLCAYLERLGGEVATTELGHT